MTKTPIKIHLISVSSCSSQLGLFVASRHHFKIYKTDDTCFLICILIRVRVALENKSTHHFLSASELLSAFPKNKRYELAFPWQLADYFVFTFILLWLARALSLLVPVTLWQPRPGWFDTKSFYQIGKFSLQILPKLNCIFYGDGFLQSCRQLVPFWLDNSVDAPLQSKRYHPPSNSDLFYYLYDLNPANILQATELLPPATVFNTISSLNLDRQSSSFFLDSYLNLFRSVVPQALKYLIFPTTTLFESDRARLPDEIAMYNEFLSLALPKTPVIPLIKPHPRSSPSKLNILCAMQNELVCTYNHPLVSVEMLSLFASLPLEYLLLHQINYRALVDESCINLVISSTAGLSAKLLFPKIHISLAFGASLLNKYLYPNAITSRLRQEEFIRQYLLGCSLD